MALTVSVPLGARAYDVRIGAFGTAEVADALAAALGRATGVAVLADGQVSAVSPRVAALEAALAARLPRVRRFDLPPGESSKTLAVVERTCQWLAEQGYDRGAAIVGVGGGATTDHAGFAASIYLRGVDFALCPTTLLAMVDASVGGKTGVDLPAGKNLVGTFHQPRAVIADLNVLETLPPRELAAGMAEVVKAGLIADARLFAALEELRGLPEPPALAEIIAAAVRVKAEVVTEDERESGRRAILNFGHTLGHALEAESAYALLHGEAVSLGMVAALALGRARGVTEPALVPRATELLARLGLPVDVAGRLGPQVLARVEVDKKRRSGGVRFVLVPRVGEAIVEEIALDELKRQAAALPPP
jgi:shikimate kinase / 3-dehydroquinate synthase